MLACSEAPWKEIVWPEEEDLCRRQWSSAEVEVRWQRTLDQFCH